MGGVWERDDKFEQRAARAVGESANETPDGVITRELLKISVLLETFIIIIIKYILDYEWALFPWTVTYNANFLCGKRTYSYNRAAIHVNKPCGARRKRSGALDSCFGLVSPHQQSIPYPYLQAPRVIKASSSAALVALN